MAVYAVIWFNVNEIYTASSTDWRKHIIPISVVKMADRKQEPKERKLMRCTEAFPVFLARVGNIFTIFWPSSQMLFVQ